MVLPPARSSGAAVPQSDGVWNGAERLDLHHNRGTAMDHSVGVDVSLELSRLCVIGTTRWIVRESRVANGPPALISFRSGLALPRACARLKAGPLSQ